MVTASTPFEAIISSLSSSSNGRDIIIIEGEGPSRALKKSNSNLSGSSKGALSVPSNNSSKTSFSFV